MAFRLVAHGSNVSEDAARVAASETGGGGPRSSAARVGTLPLIPAIRDHRQVADRRGSRCCTKPSPREWQREFQLFEWIFRQFVSVDRAVFTARPLLLVAAGC